MHIMFRLIVSVFDLQGASEKDIVHSGLAYTMERSARVSLKAIIYSHAKNLQLY